MKRKSNISKGWLLVFLIFFAAAFYKLPYYVSSPGSAEVLEPFVNVENGYQEDGAFMLTTVRMGQANIYSYLWGKVADYHNIYKVNQVRMEDESDEEYSIRQLKLMDDSQQNAILNAYRKAGKDVDIEVDGVYVLRVVDNMPAEGKLKPADRIIEVDNQIIKSQKFFLDYLSNKKPGDSIEIEINRNKKTFKETIKLKELEGTNRAGIGISLVEDRDIKTDPKVEIKAEKIGGPSAGLMFTLEIYNQLTKEDITKGRKIAGTGTIAEDGTVGPIGGIDQKVVAADKEDAEIFFAPNEKGAKKSDYQLAVKTAKEIGTDMKIVPVDHFDDALQYLEK